MRLASFIAIAVCAGSVQAAQCPGKTTVLHCEMKAQKMLTVCIGDGEASYSFGKPGAPELALTQPLGEVQGRPWPGVGGAIWEEIIFRYNDITYDVFTNTDRMTEAAPQSGGVTVLQGSRELATLNCLDGTATVDPFAVSDGFGAAGFCWDRDDEMYKRTCN